MRGLAVSDWKPLEAFVKSASKEPLQLQKKTLSPLERPIWSASATHEPNRLSLSQIVENPAGVFGKAWPAE